MINSTTIITALKTFGNPDILVNKIAVPLAKGSLSGNTIVAGWMGGITNFGDLITPLILEYYGFTPVFFPHKMMRFTQAIATGSILQWAPEDYSGHVLGSGLMYDVFHPLKQAKVWAVRGKLTRERIAASQSTVLGDPGLLASRVLKKREKRTHRLGIIPHIFEKEDPRVALIQKKYREDVLIIDVEREPLAVFRDIDRCECIISSSLHGLIVADSLGVPNGWMYLTDKVHGNGFKFRDYFSSIGKKFAPNYLTGNESIQQLIGFAHEPEHNIIEAITEELDSTFRSFRNNFRECNN